LRPLVQTLSMVVLSGLVLPTLAVFLLSNYMKTKIFTEFTPTGKKIRVKRFYYPDEKTWLCIDCFHAGSTQILASIPCERCSKGITQMSNETYGEPK